MLINPKYAFPVSVGEPEKPQFPGSRSAISGPGYYNPSAGRRLSGDPIGETGGESLYGPIQNHLTFSVVLAR